MNHRGRGGPGARGEPVGGLAAGELTGRVPGLAIKVQKTVGPGLLKQIYADCLCHESRYGRPVTGVPTAIEMALNGLAFQRQVEFLKIRLLNACGK
jgi:hypothetical protein